MDAKQERDVYLSMFEQKKRELIALGMSAEEADEKASRDIRRDIRNQPINPSR